jgi:hypothetical protein
MKHLVLLILALLGYSLGLPLLSEVNDNEKATMGPLCSYNGYWLNCSNFDTFSQLSANFRNKTYREQELLIIRPVQKLDMDGSFDLTGYDMKYSSLELANMNSFLFAPNPAQNFNPKSFYVKESNLDFRLGNGNSISLNCNNLTILSSPSILTYVRQTVIFYKVFIFYSFILTRRVCIPR